LAAESSFRRQLRDAVKRARIDVDSTQISALERYFDLLARWNRKINLTSFRLEEASEAAIDRLFVEPLQAATRIEDAPLRWFDLGSGGGSPAIPLKIVRPRLRLTMVESRARKAAFLREAARSLELGETEVAEARIESLLQAGNRDTLDLVTLRAVRTDEGLLKTLSELLRPAGQLFLFGSDLSRINRFGLETTDELKLAGTDSTLSILRKD
jgi:16S rRNA (guanine527-N7)-methyltransferase